jgi:hypothetical protein
MVEDVSYNGHFGVKKCDMGLENARLLDVLLKYQLVGLARPPATLPYRAVSFAP